VPTQAYRMIVAATRLRDAWSMPVLDVAELHESILGLLAVTGTTDLQSALAVFCDVEAGQVSVN